MFTLLYKIITLLKRALLITLVFVGVLFSNSAIASIGNVIYSYGDNYAFDLDGNRRGLSKGALIKEGDTLVTGTGRLQVRLIDGGLIAVYPNSEYKIEQFEFAAAKETDGEINLANAKESKTDKGFFNLLKGAARQVTGVLGRKYNDNFKFKTNIAAVGIRGTGFFARICQADCFDKNGIALQDGMYVKNNVGIITMANSAGDIALSQGQAAFAASSEDAPVQTDESPAASDGSDEEIETYDFDGSVNLGIIRTGLVAVPEVTPEKSTHLDYAFTKRSGTRINGIGRAVVGRLDTGVAGSSVLHSGSEITYFENSSAHTGEHTIVFDAARATLVESGADTNLGVIWNRWNGGYSLAKDGVTLTRVDRDIHLIASDQFTQDLTNLSPKGKVNYTGTGGTSPTLTIGGNTLTGTQTVNAQIDFSTGSGMQLEQLNIETDFGVATVEMRLTDTVQITSVSEIVDMYGSCRGCSTRPVISMHGVSTINLVGENAEGIFGAYNLTGHGRVISGSYVAAE